MASATTPLVVLLAVLTSLLVADRRTPPVTVPAERDTPPTADTAPDRTAADEPVRVSSAVVPNEFDYTQAIFDPLPSGAAPEADQDCAGAYRWAEEMGGQPVHGIRLRVTLTPVRYAQVVFRGLSVRVTDTPADEFRGTPVMFGCEGSPDVPYAGQDDGYSELEGTGRDAGTWFLPALQIPTDPPGQRDLPSAIEDQYPFDLATGRDVTFTVEVLIAEYSAPTRFVLDLTLGINGRDETFALRDGVRPFTLLPSPGGAGFSPDVYGWCPGSPGSLAFRDGDTMSLETRFC